MVALRVLRGFAKNDAVKAPHALPQKYQVSPN
jgi:hypothetical protein